MSLPNLLRRGSRLFCVLTALVVVSLASSSCQAVGYRALPRETSVERLRAGASFERLIAKGEIQEYLLTLPSGTFLFLEVKPVGTGVEADLTGPQGEIAAEGPKGVGRLKLLALIVQAGGDYRLKVRTLSEGVPPQGRYLLSVRGLRPAEPKDEMRVQAARALSAGRSLLATGDGASKDQAIEQLKESLSRWESAGDVEGEVDTLTELGRAGSDSGRWQEALAYHQKALRRSQEGRFDRGAAWALGNLAYCHLRLGDADQAIELYQRALEAWRLLGQLSEQAFTGRGLGRAYMEKGDLDTAMRIFQDAYLLAVQSGNVVEQANSLNAVSIIHFGRGNLSEAMKASRQVLELYRLTGDAQSEAVIENNIATIYHTRGQLQKAIDIYIRQIDRVALKDKGVLFSNLGSLYLELGDLGKALENYELALASFQKIGDRNGEVEARTAVASVFQRMGDAKAALAECEKARGVLSSDPWNVPHFCGLAQFDLGLLPEALKSLEQAAAIAHSRKETAKEASSLLATGSVHLKLGQLDLAAGRFEAAIRLGGEFPSIVAPGLLRHATVREEQGRWDEAKSDIEKAIEIIELTRRNVAGQQLQVGFFASKQAYYGFYIDLLLRLAEIHPQEKEAYSARALEVSEKARARGLLDLLAEGRIDVSQGLGPDLREREERLADELAKVQSESRMRDPGSQRAQELEMKLKELIDAREKLDWEIRGRNARYAQVRYPIPLKVSEIQAHDLDPDTALLEYVLGEERSTLFVVTLEGLSTYKLPPADEIAKEVRRLRAALERPSPLNRSEYIDSASRLYQTLMAPAERELSGKANLLVAPDRGLYYIPFEALLTEPGKDRSYRDLPYLLRRHAIAYIPSASVLAGLREPRPGLPPAERRNRVVAFAPFAPPENEAVKGGRLGAASDRSKSSFWSLAPLPASKREVAGIAALYAGSSLQLIGKEANEQHVKENPAVAVAQRLHFATHAILNERNPEFSALALAPQDGGTDDGLLQVYEIFNLKLSADLAVLSACETALGKEVTGEGLIGLTRAFFYAGVPSLVVSLWNVTDGAAPDLMLDFYKGLDQPGSKAGALRQAKLAMIAKGTYVHPSYWAPFILLGEPK